MRSFLTPDAEVGPETLFLGATESHHLAQVRRARVGEAVEVLDGKGRLWRTEITRADRQRTELAIQEKLEIPPPPVQRILGLPLLKSAAFELVLRMATEIGVERIQIIPTENAEVQIGDKKRAAKLERWQGILAEAGKQSGRLWFPQIAFADSLTGYAPPEALKIIASLEEKSYTIPQLVSENPIPETVAMAIGPEGDLTAEEYARFREAGFHPVTIGNVVLRADTAVAVLLAQLAPFVLGVASA